MRTLRRARQTWERGNLRLQYVPCVPAVAHRSVRTAVEGWRPPAGPQRENHEERNVIIRLVEPAAPGMHVYSRVRLPRLGLPIIGAVLKARGHDVSIYCGDFEPVDWNDVYSADLVGFSTTTSTVPEAYHHADELRRRGVPVVIGGSHVTFMADEALEHADYVARGEGGEQLMLELIEALTEGRSLDSIRGLSFRRDGRTVHNPLRDPVADLDSLPFPDFTLIHGHKRMTQTPIMTSWGCPFDCRFCSVTAMFGKKYRFRSNESIIEELLQKRPRKVFFYDDNMAANRNRLKQLLEMMIRAKLNISWSAQMRTDVAKDRELLDLMHRSGCWNVFLGLESINQDTLDGYDKAQSVEDIIRAVDTLHDFGISCHGMFVLGADSDGPSVVRDTVRFAVKHKIDTVMLNILTPLPGTPLFDELDAQGRIFDKRWQLYDALHVVFTPKQMTPYHLQRETIRGYAHFYGLRRWLGYLFTFRFAKLVFQTWGYTIMRAWRKDKRNRSFMQALKRLHLPSGSDSGLPRASMDSR
jgi:anaerobic magnesium-protoporphyrin IX monomethyl ester cyclase